MNRLLLAFTALMLGVSGVMAAPPRYLALGDSYTVGESVDPGEAWPAQLSSRLKIPPPLIIARTGWTTDELNEAIDKEKPHGPFQLVTLSIGVNNQYRGRSAADYQPEFSSLLARAIQLAGGSAKRVVVVSIPDWGASPFARDQDRAKISSEIDAFNAVSRMVTEKAGAHYVDINPQSKSAASQPSMFAGDGLHPSGDMYAEWVRLALPAARAALKGGR